MRIKKGIEINAFARKWSDEFVDENINVDRIKSELEEDALKLGFVDDGFASLKEEYDEGYETDEDLYWVLRYIHDENIIGNMILSKYGECIKNDSFVESRDWFYSVISYLEVMTDIYLEMFQGTPVSFELISNSMKEGDEFYWQEFKLDRNGNVEFRKIVPSINTDDPQQEESYVIPKDQAKKMLKEVVTALNQEVRNQNSNEEIPNWDIRVSNTNDDEYLFCGCYSHPLALDGIDLSCEIRSSIEEKDLMLFDGTGDIIGTNEKIQSVVLEYHHAQDIFDEIVRESYHLEADEKLIVDVAGEMVTIESRFKDGYYTRHQYHVPGSAGNILGEFSANSLFKEIKERPNNIVPIPDQEFTYKITVNYESAKPLELYGEYDELGLPTDYPQFMANLRDFFRNYGLGECINPVVFGRRRRKTNEVTYISVIFEEDSEDSYYYLCDDDSVEIDDIVVVPAGQENELKLVEVVDIEYFDPHDVPYPIDEVKKMIRKAKLDDFK